MVKVGLSQQETNLGKLGGGASLLRGAPRRCAPLNLHGRDARSGLASTLVRLLRFDTEWPMTNIVKRLRADAYSLSLRALLEERDEAAREIERLTDELERVKAGPPIVDRVVPVRLAERGGRGKAPPVEPSLLRLSDVCQLVGLSRSSIYASIAVGRFPAPVQIGARAVRWRVEDVRAWIASPPTQQPVKHRGAIGRIR